MSAPATQRAAEAEPTTAPTIVVQRTPDGVFDEFIVTFPAPITPTEFWGFVVARHYFDRHPAGYGLGRIRVDGTVGVYTCAASCD